MLVGVHENYQGNRATTFARTAGSFPGTEVTREFTADVLQPQDLVRHLVARCQPIWEASKVTVWSFKPDAAAVDSGRWKPHVEALAAYIKKNRLQSKVIVCVWHEPENDFRQPEDFVRLYNTVHDWIKSVDPSIQTTHAALGFYYRNVSAPTAKRWITKADIHSIDIYSGRSFPLDMTLGTSKAFQTWRKALPAGAKWGVSERGWIADSTKAVERVASIEAEAEWLAALPVAERPAFYIVWNTPGTENDPKIVLDNAGTAAVNKLFGRLSQVVCPLCQGTGFAEAGKQYVVTGGNR